MGRTPAGPEEPGTYNTCMYFRNFSAEDTTYFETGIITEILSFEEVSEQYTSLHALEENNWVRSDYEFVNWNTLSDGSGITYEVGSTSLSTSMVLYAQYIERVRNYIVTDTELTSIADTIRAKSGQSGSLSFPNGFVDGINSISGGGTSEPIDAIRFFDYDGTLLHQYTKTQFLALESMPANPSHTGLIAQGWNWTLSDAQNFVENWDFLDIGQIYDTESGATEIDIEIPEGCENIPIYLRFGVKGTAIVNWGDGTSDTYTGTSTYNYNRDHTYSSNGNYTITITLTTSGTNDIIDFTSSSTGNSLLFPKVVANSNYGFYCVAKWVRAIRLGAKVQLGSYAFHALGIDTITLSSTITFSISGGYTFSDCHSLKACIFPNNTTLALNGSYNMFQECASLKVVCFSNKVTSMANNFFYHCYSLSQLIIPDTTTLNNNTFYTSTVLLRKVIPQTNTIFNIERKTITINDNTEMMPYLYQNLKEIQSVVINDPVTTIPDALFSGCNYIENLILPDTLTSVGSNGFGSIYGIYDFDISNLSVVPNYISSSWYSLHSINLPANITTIPTYTFRYCYSLHSIEIPDTVTTLGTYVFQNNYSLTHVELPSGLTSIGNYCFSTCYGLYTITIPETVTTIGNSVFENCYGMRKYHFLSTTPPTLGSNVFKNIPGSCTIYVPSESLSAYKSATNWSTYANYMVGE